MSLYINSAVASEHQAQLIREAAAWRLRHRAKQAAAARRAAAKPAAAVGEPVYCHRAVGAVGAVGAARAARAGCTA